MCKRISASKMTRVCVCVGGEKRNIVFYVTYVYFDYRTTQTQNKQESGAYSFLSVKIPARNKQKHIENTQIQSIIDLITNLISPRNPLVLHPSSDI